MTYNELQKFWERAENGGRKSIRFEELDSKYFFESKPEVLVPYLDMIQLDLNNRP
jgi:recombination protein U